MEPPCTSVTKYFDEWLEKDGYPFWSLWENVRTWWATRNLPNVHVVHFADLKANMPGEICRIAEFLAIPVDQSKWEQILLHCSFDYMKANAAKSVPLAGAFWEGGAETFIHKGTNGRWREILSAEQIRQYEKRAMAELGAECAHWLASGELPE
ncbi:MAG: sulfotransferase domain-containing protein [Haliea sp.]